MLIVDDHPIVRERLAELIDQEPDLVVCGQAPDAFGAMEQIAATHPDVAVVDITLKDGYGIELIKDIRNQYPKLPVLVLSMHDESLYAERALRAGAKGYITKQEATRQVLVAIRRVLQGGIYVSEKMASLILHLFARGRSETARSSLGALSDRELEVFELIGQGVAVRDIARTLHISPKTVEAHRAHIKEKLYIGTSAELLRYAIQTSLQER